MSKIESEEEIHQISSEQQKYLEFGVGEECYAVPLFSIREVIPPPETTPLPNGPDYFEGIMNLRGQIISIIDLRRKLKIKTKTPPVQGAVVIIDIESVSVGLVVDSINKVLSFGENDLVDVPEISNQINASFIQGIFKNEDHLTVLLEMRNVLDMKTINKLKKIA